MSVWSDFAVNELLGGISEVLGTPAPLTPGGGGPVPGPAAPPPEVRSHLSDDEAAALKYMGIDPDTAPLDQINQALKKMGKTPLGAPTAPPSPGVTDPSLNNPPPPVGQNPIPGAAAPDGLSGAAADAAKKLDDALEHNRNALNSADEQLADALLKAHSSSDAGKAKLQQLQQSIIDEVGKLGPSMDTQAGQEQLATFLQGKTSEISNVLSTAELDSTSQAAVLDGLTARLNALGQKPGDPAAKDDPGPGSSQSDPATAGSSGTPGGPAATSGETGAEPGSDPLLNGLPSDSLMSGLGPAMGALGGLPGALGSMMPFGGGGGLGGGGLPLGDLGSALGSAVHDPTSSSNDGDAHDHNDTSAPLKDPATSDDDSKDAAHKHDGTDSASDSSSANQGQQAGTNGQATPAAAGPGQVTAAGLTTPAAPGTTVKLPGDAGTRTAATPQLADAVRAVLNGDNINQAFAQNDLPLSPPGTPVTNPISPGKLELGATGQFTDHRVLALGDGKVWNNGQVVALHDLDTGPNFLGWEPPPTSAQTPPAPTTTGTATVPTATHSEQPSNPT